MERTSIKQLRTQALFLFGYGKLFEIYSRHTPDIYLQTSAKHLPFSHKIQIHASPTRGHCQQTQPHVFVKDNQNQKQS